MRFAPVTDLADAAISAELLDQILERLRSTGPDERQAITSLVQRATAHVLARSCTFLPAALSDNFDLAETG